MINQNPTPEPTTYKLSLPEGTQQRDSFPSLGNIQRLLGDAEWQSSRVFLTMMTDGSPPSASSVPIYLDFPEGGPSVDQIGNELPQFTVSKVPSPAEAWLREVIDEVTAGVRVETVLKQGGAELAHHATTGADASPDLIGAQKSLKNSREPVFVQLQCLDASEYLRDRAATLETRSSWFDELNIRSAVTALWAGKYQQYSDIEAREYEAGGYLLTTRVLGEQTHGRESSSITPHHLAERFTMGMNGDTSATTTDVDPEALAAAVQAYEPPQEVGVARQAWLALPFTACRKPYLTCTASELSAVLGEPQ